MSLDLIKKKIQLYVSESGAQKSAKYYRIPTPSDSMEYSRENNAFKNCVRWYAKISGDRIYFSYIGTSRIGMYSTKNNEANSLRAITPVIPPEFLNDGETHLMLNPMSNSAFNGVFSSETGFGGSYNDYTNTVDQNAITKSNIFTNSSIIFSDSISDLSTAVPSTWIELDNINTLVADLKSWLSMSLSDENIDRTTDIVVEDLLAKLEATPIYTYYLANKKCIMGSPTIREVDRGTRAYNTRVPSFIIDNENYPYALKRTDDTTFENDTFKARFTCSEELPKVLVMVYKKANGETGSRTFSSDELKNEVSIPEFSTYQYITFKPYYSEIKITMEVTSKILGALDYATPSDRLKFPIEEVRLDSTDGGMSGYHIYPTNSYDSNTVLYDKFVKVMVGDIAYRDKLNVKFLIPYYSGRIVDVLKVMKDGTIENLGKVKMGDNANVYINTSLKDMNYLLFSADPAYYKYERYQGHSRAIGAVEFLLYADNDNPITFEDRKASTTRNNINIVEYNKSYSMGTSDKLDITQLTGTISSINMAVKNATIDFCDESGTLIRTVAYRNSATTDTVPSGDELSQVKFIYVTALYTGENAGTITFMKLETTKETYDRVLSAPYANLTMFGSSAGRNYLEVKNYRNQIPANGSLVLDFRYSDGYRILTSDTAITSTENVRVLYKSPNNENEYIDKEMGANELKAFIQTNSNIDVFVIIFKAEGYTSSYLTFTKLASE